MSGIGCGHLPSGTRSCQGSSLRKECAGGVYVYRGANVRVLLSSHALIRLDWVWFIALALAQGKGQRCRNTHVVGGDVRHKGGGGCSG